MTQPQASSASAPLSIFARRAAEGVLAELHAKREIARGAQPPATLTPVEGARLQRDAFLIGEAEWQAKEDRVHTLAAGMSVPQAAWALVDRAARRWDARAALARRLNPAPTVPVPLYRVPQLHLPDGTAVEFPQWRDWLTPLNVPSTDGLSLLDAMLIRHPTLEDDAPLLLVAIGSGGMYERSLDISHALADRHNMQVLIYNPRGVGNSLGKMCSTQDLVQDFRCMLDFALSRAPKVAVLGRSMGGGTASEGLAQLQAADPARAARVGLLLLENTFSSFSAAAAHQVHVPPALMGAVYGALRFLDLSPVRALPHCAPTLQVVVSHIHEDPVIGEAAGLHRAVQLSAHLTVAPNLPRAGLLTHDNYVHASKTLEALQAWRDGAV